MLRRALFACLLLIAPAARAQDIDLTQVTTDQLTASGFYYTGQYLLPGSDDPATASYPYGIDLDGYDADNPAYMGLGPDDYDDTSTPFGDVRDVAYRMGLGGEARFNILQDTPQDFRIRLALTPSGSAGGLLHTWTGFVSILVVDTSDMETVLRLVIPVYGFWWNGTPQFEWISPTIHVPPDCRIYACTLGEGMAATSGVFLLPLLEECDMWNGAP